MSQLIDKLNRVSKTAPQSMGFRAVQPSSPKSPMLFIASLTYTGGKDTDTADYVAGADAVLLNIAKSGWGLKALQKIAQSLPDIPWGGRLEEINEEKIKTMAEAGGDFIVFSAESNALSAPQDDKLGRILRIDSSLNEGLLKAVNELPVDAVLAGNEQEEQLTWHHLMLYQRFASLLSKPLLAPVSANITADEIKAIWETGVDGVIAKVSAIKPEGGLKDLRKAIDDLILLSPRKQRKIEAILPRISRDTNAVTDTEEEEDEEK